MLAKWKTLLLDFITTDVKSELETKELAVLIRVLCVVFSVYYLVLSVLVSGQGYYILSLLLIFIVGLLVGSFICTYENRTHLSLHLFNSVITLTSAALAIVTGFSYGYHWILVITILLSFYDYTNSLKSKFIHSIFAILCMIFITIFCHLNPVVKASNDNIRIAITIINSVVFTFTITTIAYFYCSKFTDSETKIIQYNKKLLQMASLDSLTQLPNRRTINEHLQDLVFASSKSGSPFCLAIGDVDFFKHVNDKYGHDAGDYVLRVLATSFQDYMHGKGIVGRWGGEEFLFTIENVHLGQAIYDLQKLLDAIGSYDFHYKENHFRITMTFGVEEYQEHLGIEAVISMADEKLYRGKKSGRNQVNGDT